MTLLDLLDQIDETAPRSCQTCKFMGTKENCEGCLYRDEDKIGWQPPKEYKYYNWQPGNWLRRKHELQVDGSRNIVIGWQGEAEVNTGETPSHAYKNLSWVSEQCGYVTSRPVVDGRVTKLTIWTDYEYAIYWFDGVLTRIDRVATDESPRAHSWHRLYADAEDISFAREIMDIKDAWRAAGGHGPIEMRFELWYDEHTDFRNEDQDNPNCLAMGPDGGTWLVPVKFVEAAKEGGAS